MAGLRDARKAVARGDYDEALVLLWNELEPARIEGDRNRLVTIADLAARIAAAGDDAQRREAERLGDAAAEHGADGAVAATERVDATVAMPDGGIPGGLPPELEDMPVEEELPERGRPGLGTILWIVLVGGVILLNLLRDLAERL